MVTGVDPAFQILGFTFSKGFDLGKLNTLTKQKTADFAWLSQNSLRHRNNLGRRVVHRGLVMEEKLMILTKTRLFKYIEHFTTKN